MTPIDQALLTLTAWRENRGGGPLGMQSGVNVVMKRCQHSGKSPYEECTKKWQFSSISAPGGTQLALWPAIGDPAFAVAQHLAEMAAGGSFDDITGNATFYYANSMTHPPSWAAAMVFTVEIENQKFFRQ